MPAAPTWSTDFESGLLDDFDFTIKESYFAPDQNYNSGNTLLLQWHGTTDNEDVPETRIIFPLGKGWESRDGGKTIQHESGKPGKYFVSSSIIAHLIARCIQDLNIGDLLAERGDPFTASVWQGMRFHMKSTKIDFGSGLDARARLFPVQFLGLADAAPAVTAIDAKAKVAAAKAKAAPKVSLRDQVVAAMTPYVEAGDFEGAQTAAFEIDGVSDDPIVDELLDESGLYAEIAGTVAAAA